MEAPDADTRPENGTVHAAADVSTSVVTECVLVYWGESGPEGVASFERTDSAFPDFLADLGDLSLPFRATVASTPMFNDDAEPSTTEGFFDIRLLSQAPSGLDVWAGSQASLISASSLIEAGQMTAHVPTFQYNLIDYDTVQVFCFLSQ